MNRKSTVKISVEELRELTIRAVKHFGYNDEHTAVISDVLLYAQLRGNNQGVAKLIGKGIPVNPDAGDITIVKDTPVSARIDGGHLVCAIDPGLLGDRDEFSKNVSALIDKLKSSKRLPGAEEINYPGERGRKLTEAHIASNEIEVEDNLLSDLRKAAAG